MLLTATNPSLVQLSHSLALIGALRFTVEPFHHDTTAKWDQKQEHGRSVLVVLFMFPGRNVSLELIQHATNSELHELLFGGIQLTKSLIGRRQSFSVEISCEMGFLLTIRVHRVFMTSQQQGRQPQTPAEKAYAEKKIASPVLCDPKQRENAQEKAALIVGPKVDDESTQEPFFGCIRNVVVGKSRSSSFFIRPSSKEEASSQSTLKVLDSWCRELSPLSLANGEGMQRYQQQRSLNIDEEHTKMLVEETPTPRISPGFKGSVISGLGLGTRIPLDESFLKVEGLTSEQEIVVEQSTPGIKLEDRRSQPLNRFTVSQFLNKKVFVTSDGGNGEFRLVLQQEDSDTATLSKADDDDSSSTTVASENAIAYKVTPVSVHLKLLKNSGIRLYHQSATTITAQNLSFTTNFPGEVPIRYSVVDQPEYGVIECQRKQQNSGFVQQKDPFLLCSNFLQDDIDAHRVQYRHTSGTVRPADSFGFQVHAGESSSIVHVFHVNFVPISVRVSLDEPLMLNTSFAEGVKVTRRQLRTTAFPQSLPSDAFTYTVVEAPKLGMLTRLVSETKKQRRIGVSSNFTQMHVDEELITYRLNSPSLQPLEDYLTFRLFTPISILGDRLFRMDIVYSPPPIVPGGPQGPQPKNQTLVVSERGRQTIGKKGLWVTSRRSESEPVSAEGVLHQFAVLMTPLNGQLLLHSKEGKNVSLGVGATFSAEDVTSGRVFYEHSGVESSLDRIAFIRASPHSLLATEKAQQQSQSPVVVWLGVSVLPVEDEAPRFRNAMRMQQQTVIEKQLQQTSSAHAIHVLERGERVLHSSLFPWTDLDQIGPVDRPIVAHAMAQTVQPLRFAFTDPFRNFIVAARDTPERTMSNFTMKQLRRNELILRHLGPRNESILRYQVSDGKHVVHSSVQFLAIRSPFVRLLSRSPARFYLNEISSDNDKPLKSSNKDLFVLVTLNELAVETNLDIDPDEIEFAVRSTQRRSPFWMLSSNKTLAEAYTFRQKDIVEHRLFLSLDDLIRDHPPKTKGSFHRGGSKLSAHIPFVLSTPKNLLKQYSPGPKPQQRSPQQFVQVNAELIVELCRENEEKNDDFRTTGFSWTADLTFSLGAIQSDLEVDQEGTCFTVDQLSMVASSSSSQLAGRWLRAKYFVVEPPRHGQLVFDALNQSVSVWGFTQEDVIARRIRFVPDERGKAVVDRFSVELSLSWWNSPSLASRRLLDELLPALGPFSILLRLQPISVRDGQEKTKKNAHLCASSIAWDRFKDTRLTQNTLFKIPAGRLSAPITAEALKVDFFAAGSSADAMIAADEIRFLAWNLTGGCLELNYAKGRQPRRGFAVASFTQADVNAGRLSFVANIEANVQRRRETRGFMFVYETFGAQNPVDYWFGVELERGESVQTATALLETNRLLAKAAPGVPFLIDSSYLKATLPLRASPKQIVYKITRQPLHGRLLLNDNTSATFLPFDGVPFVKQFRQADLDARLLSYKPVFDLGAWSQRDTFHFKIAVAETDFDDPEQEHRFRIHISYANTPPTGLHRLVQLSPIVVSWNGSTVINIAHVNLTRLASFCCRNDELVVELRRPPENGWLQRVGDLPNSVFSAQASPEEMESGTSESDAVESFEAFEPSAGGGERKDDDDNDEDEDDEDEEEEDGRRSDRGRSPMGVERLHSGRGLVYRHRPTGDDSADEDRFQLVVFASRGRHSPRAKLRVPVRVIVEPRLHPVLATRIERFSEELSIVSGGSVRLSSENFLATHPSRQAHSIVYRVVQSSSSGAIRLCFHPKMQQTAKSEAAAVPRLTPEVREFTQAQIDAGLVWLEHHPTGLDTDYADDDASAAELWRRYNTIVFRISPNDEDQQGRGSQTRVLIIRVEPLALRLVNHTEIAYEQGKTYVVLSNRHLGAESNEGDRSKIVYNVTRRPANGTFYWVEGENEAWVFSQRDLDTGALLYAQLNMHAFQDHFDFVLSNDELELLPKRSRIVVQPLVQPRTLAIEYLVVSRPQHGHLFFQSQPNESVTFFTHADVKAGRVFFHASDLSTNESGEEGRPVTDHVEFEIRSDSTQPARLKWNIEIRPSNPTFDSSKAPMEASDEQEDDVDDQKSLEPAKEEGSLPALVELNMNYHFPIFILLGVVATVMTVLLCRKNNDSHRRSSDSGDSDDETSGGLKRKKKQVETRQQRLRRLLQLPTDLDQQQPMSKGQREGGGGSIRARALTSILDPQSAPSQGGGSALSPMMVARGPYRNGELRPPIVAPGGNGRSLLSGTVYASSSSCALTSATSPAARSTTSNYDNATLPLKLQPNLLNVVPGPELFTPTRQPLLPAPLWESDRQHRHHFSSSRRRASEVPASRRRHAPGTLSPRGSINNLFPSSSSSTKNRTQTQHSNLLATAAAAAASKGLPRLRWPLRVDETSSLRNKDEVQTEMAAYGHENLLSQGLEPAARPTLEIVQQPVGPSALITQTHEEGAHTTTTPMTDDTYRNHRRGDEMEKRQEEEERLPPPVRMSSETIGGDQLPLRRNEFWV